LAKNISKWNLEKRNILIGKYMDDEVKKENPDVTNKDVNVLLEYTPVSTVKPNVIDDRSESYLDSITTNRIKKIRTEVDKNRIAYPWEQDIPNYTPPKKDTSNYEKKTYTVPFRSLTRGATNKVLVGSTYVITSDDGGGQQNQTQSDSTLTASKNMDLIKGSGFAMAINIKNFTFGFDLIGYNKSNHGDFNLRYKLTGGRASYTKVDDFKGWGDLGFKNYINWSYLVSHNGTGRGDESDVRWGQYQPVGALIYKGKNYGCKTFSSSYKPCYYFLNGSNEAVRTTSGEIFKAKRGSTVDAISNANFLSNIRLAASAGGGSFIRNGQYYSVDDSFNKSTFPFFGKVSDGTYIAGYGAGSKNIVSNVLKYFSGVNKTVSWLDVGDGGGSPQMAFNGEMIFGGKRPISVIIGWA
jgi:hypothetical protein